MSTKYLDLQLIQSLTIEQKKQLIPKLARRANDRLRALEKNKLTDASHAYEIAQVELRDASRFKESTKNLTDSLVNIELAQLTEFLNAETSTVSGAKEKQLAESKALFRFEEDYGLPLKGHARDFFTFLKSNQFKQLSQYMDSNQVVEDFIDALSQEYSVKQIRKQYSDYLRAHNGQADSESFAELYGKRAKRLSKKGKLYV